MSSLLFAPMTSPGGAPRSGGGCRVPAGVFLTASRGTACPRPKGERGQDRPAGSRRTLGARTPDCRAGDCLRCQTVLTCVCGGSKHASPPGERGTQRRHGRHGRSKPARQDARRNHFPNRAWGSQPAKVTRDAEPTVRLQPQGPQAPLRARQDPVPGLIKQISEWCLCVFSS